MSAIRFTIDDLERARREWNCSCGPAALAAICGLTLEEVREHFPGFKGWTNPSMMLSALRSWGGRWASIGVARGELAWPGYGIALIQFEGPWTNPVPPERERWARIDRAKRTHWVGAWTGRAETGATETQVFDVNTVGEGATRENGSGWLPLAWWSDSIAPALAASYKRATGGWHITHAIEVERP